MLRCEFLRRCREWTEAMERLENSVVFQKKFPDEEAERLCACIPYGYQETYMFVHRCRYVLGEEKTSHIIDVLCGDGNDLLNHIGLDEILAVIVHGKDVFPQAA